MPDAGDQLAPTVLDNEAVVFQLEHPLKVFERHRFPRQWHRLKCHAESISGGIAKGGRTHDGTCQLIQFPYWSRLSCRCAICAILVVTPQKQPAKHESHFWNSELCQILRRCCTRTGSQAPNDNSGRSIRVPYLCCPHRKSRIPARNRGTS